MKLIKHPFKSLVFLMASLVIVPITSAQLQSGSITMNSPLYEEPDRDGKSSSTLAAGTEVSILELKTTWYRVRVNGDEAQEGWVWLNVKPDSESGWFSGLKNLLNDDAGKNKKEVTATIGIRGLEKGDIKKARPNKAELKKLDRFASDEEEAIAYADKINLRRSKHSNN